MNNKIKKLSFVSLLFVLISCNKYLRTETFKSYSVFFSINLKYNNPNMFNNKTWLDTTQKKITIFLYDISKEDTFEIFINNKKIKEIYLFPLEEHIKQIYPYQVTYDYSKYKHSPILTIKLKKYRFYKEKYDTLLVNKIIIANSPIDYYNKNYDCMQLVIDERYSGVFVSYIENMEIWDVTYSNFIYPNVFQ